MNTLITDVRPPEAGPPVASRITERSLMVAGFCVFAILLGLSALIYTQLKAANVGQAERAFDSRKTEVVTALEQRLTAYSQVLRGGLGLFAGSESVSRQEWKTYVAALEIERRYPGIQGIGYAEFVTPQNLAAYEQAIQDEGHPGFGVRPAGARQLYSSITFLEPFDQRNKQAFGYDMYSQATRSAAMDRARDSGGIAISGKVTLVQEITTDVQAGFLIYLPFYGVGVVPDSMTERRDSIKGFVYSPLRMGDLMHGVLGASLNDVSLQIFDDDRAKGAVGDPAKLMFVGDKHPSQLEAGFVDTILFQFGGHIWTLEIAAQPWFVASHSLADPAVAFIICLVVSLLVFGIMLGYATTQRRAQAIAREMTESLEERGKELARSNQELERFAYAASHDLRSPLRAISSLTGWLESDLDPVLTEDSREHLVLMRSRISRMEALLSGLLEYSRIGEDGGQVQLVDGRTIARDLIDTLDIPAGFTINAAPDLPSFYGHRAPIAHVLQNLVDNAIKHHDRPDGTVWITGADVGDFVHFTVTDDGPGVPEAYHARIFEMFQTLKRRDEVEGSGLGLAMVKRYIERNGGVITVDSTDGNLGSAFKFTWRKALAPDMPRLAPKAGSTLQEAA